MVRTNVSGRSGGWHHLHCHWRCDCGPGQRRKCPDLVLPGCKKRVSYLIVENSVTEHADFSYWRESQQALKFQKIFEPAVIRMAYRMADLENASRNHGVTLDQIAGRTANAPELRCAQ